jgi:8-oxo-dGTP pyrophosphatase MutT (NUDIX family)
MSEPASAGARSAVDALASGQDELAPLRRALRSLADPPQPPGWNHEELIDLLGPGERTPAAVLVPLVRRVEGVQVLLTRRTDGMRTHAGQVSFPGGRIDPGDADAIDAALRETQEETGIDRRLIQPFGFLDSFETVSGYCVTPLVGEIDASYVLAPDPNEVAEVFEVPLAFLLDASNLKRHSIDWQGKEREIYEFHHGGRRIWGATAAMLVNLQRRIERENGRT